MYKVFQQSTDYNSKIIGMTLNFKKIMEIVHLVMVHSYNQIFIPPLRILFNVIWIVSGGVRIQIQTYINFSKNADKP